MSVQINRVTNANVYVNGANFLGRAEEINLPAIKSTDSEHKALGMFGKLEYSSGIDKLEADIKWNSFYPEVVKIFADIYSGIKLQVRTHIETYEGNSRVDEKPVVIYLSGRSKEHAGGNFKAQDNVELSNKLAVTYYKLEIDGEELIEIDVESNIYRVNGVDKLAAYRNSLGI
jgi:uncharacterized protein